MNRLICLALLLLLAWPLATATVQVIAEWPHHSYLPMITKPYVFEK